ncbi:MAG: hypothetical protein BAJALOKI2v1_390049 [Promethearchaeota archaeon]|nr:MAG: hypothetical protein BAJALOKI2v1_390049 [Candidatus Lokiarchaeota archaeon]
MRNRYAISLTYNRPISDTSDGLLSYYEPFYLKEKILLPTIKPKNKD